MIRRASVGEAKRTVPDPPYIAAVKRGSFFIKYAYKHSKPAEHAKPIKVGTRQGNWISEDFRLTQETLIKKASLVSSFLTGNVV